MDNTAQLVRWSVPGGVFGLAIFGSWGLSDLIFSRNSVESITAAAAKDQSLAAALIAIFASIPVGFVIYQIYFIFFDEMRFLTWMIGVPADRGALILRELDPGQRRYVEKNCVADVQLNSTSQAKIHRTRLRLLRPNHDKKALRRYRRARRENWRALQWLLADQFGADPAPIFTSRCQSLSDLYHALGAARTAVLVGVGCFAATAIGTNFSELAGHLTRAGEATIGLVVAAVLVGGVIHLARGHTSQNLTDSLIDMLRTTVPGRAVGASGAERRRYARRPVSVPLTVSYSTARGSIAAEVIDGSRGGLAFRTRNDNMTAGDVLDPPANHNGSLDMPRHEIVLVERGADKSFIVRCAFTSDAENLIWLSQLAH